MDKTPKSDILKQAARVVVKGKEGLVTVSASDDNKISVTYEIYYPLDPDGIKRQMKYTLSVTEEEWERLLISAIVEGN